MKTNLLKSILILGAASLFFACEPIKKDDPKPISGNFDIWVNVAGTGGGMGTDATIIVKNVASLDDAATTIDFNGTGIDVTAKLYKNSFIKDGYYYQIPKEGDRFGKYSLKGNTVEVVKEIPLDAEFAPKARMFDATWIDHSTLVMVGSTNSYKDISWIKINTENMSVLKQGKLTLDLEGATDYRFSTSGLLSYRKADGKLLYMYSVKKNSKPEGQKASYTSKDYNVAFINPATMAVESVAKETRAAQTSGTAYGHSLQTETFYTENGDFYIKGKNKIGTGMGAPSSEFLTRIPAGSNKFDDYKGLGETELEIDDMDYLGNDELLMYIKDDTHTANEDTPYYYAIFNLKSKTLTELTVGDTKLPYCAKVAFPNPATVVGNKAYLGVYSPDFSGVYIYDTKAKTLVKGSSITAGFEFSRVVFNQEK